MTDQTPPAFDSAAPAKPWMRLGVKPSLWWLAPLAGVAAVSALVVGMALAHVIDDDMDFGPGTVTVPQSRAVAIASRLVFREVDQHKWTANDPFFTPSGWLDNMPNFQQGMVAALARYVRVMADMSDRGQGPDMELERAAGLLTYPGTIWKFDPSTSWLPTASSEKQYRNAARNLAEYNNRQIAGTGDAERNAEALQTLVAALGQDLAAASAIIDKHLAEGHSALFDPKADDVFYVTKGKVYAYALLLREIGWDYAHVLTARDQAAQWRQMVESLKAAAALEPAVVLNGAPDGNFVPSHLTAQGFYLLRARAQLTDIAEHLAR
ncbi:MAG: DUF2333 family protein [Rhodospirillaceae bacterium]|nr:DUF2333 family protein [Rhodospirillales bacterium]